MKGSDENPLNSLLDRRTRRSENRCRETRQGTITDSPLTQFQHPHGTYRLAIPVSWEYRVEQDGRQCGFGPRDRDDVGLWISILPIRVESDQLGYGLREILHQAIGSSVAEIREDDSLRHMALTAASLEEENGGSFWLIAGGDLVLLASTKFPSGERHPWEACFARVMATLQITRDAETTELRVRRKLLERLRRQFPDAGFEIEGDRIGSGEQVIYPGNLVRRILRDPENEDAKIAEFASGLAFVGDDAPSAETLRAVRHLITPAIKPADYLRPDGPTSHVVHRPWLANLLVCYAIEGERTLRFVLEDDIRRWGIDVKELHDLSIANLTTRDWPGLPDQHPNEGPLILLRSTGESRRILDPRLHATFAHVVGDVFFAATPERDTLVIVPGFCAESLDGARKAVRQDFETAAYPISSALFRVSLGRVALVEDGSEES